MRFNLITFGCKLNQAESEKISADLIMGNWRKSEKDSEVLIANVCAVTHKAVREGRQKIAELRRKYKNAKIVVAGCIVEDDWEGVDLWATNKDKDKIVQILNEKIEEWGIEGAEDGVCEIRGRNRVFIKIQDGCDNFCAYCIIPFIRGRPKSRLIGEILEEILEKEKHEYKEVVLTGVNIGLYKDGKKDLADLLRIILEKTKIRRIRLGSLWPTDVTDNLIKLMRDNTKLCPHFHLSIQSGSDRVLKLMGRKYVIRDVMEIVRKCRKRIKNINFTCDMIVGFPGETDEDFKDSYELVEKIGFSKVHVFKYSVREGTRAAKMKDQADEETKQKRSEILRLLAEKKSEEVKSGFIGMEFEVLWEDKKDGYWHGWTENYIKARKRIDKTVLKNKIEKHRIIDLSRD